MTPITLLLTLEPMGCPRPRATVRAGRGATYMPSDYLKWQGAAVAAITDQLVGRDVAWLSTGCRAHIEAVFDRPAGPRPGWTMKAWRGGPRVRRLSTPDADNVWKASVDALQIALRDRLAHPFDDRVVEGGAVDRWYAAAGERPSLRIVLTELDPADVAAPVAELLTCPLCGHEAESVSDGWRARLETLAACGQPVDKSGGAP